MATFEKFNDLVRSARDGDGGACMALTDFILEDPGSRLTDLAHVVADLENYLEYVDNAEPARNPGEVMSCFEAEWDQWNRHWVRTSEELTRLLWCLLEAERKVDCRVYGGGK